MSGPPQLTTELHATLLLAEDLGSSPRVADSRSKAEALLAEYRKQHDQAKKNFASDQESGFAQEGINFEQWAAQNAPAYSVAHQQLAGAVAQLEQAVRHDGFTKQVRFSGGEFVYQ